MSFNPNQPVEVYINYSHDRQGEEPHWLLSLQSPGATKCTWIHSTGGPSQGRDYECSIQANKSAQSRGIASSSLLGNVSANDVNKVIAAAKRIVPQHCQMYVVAVVAELRRKVCCRKGRLPVSRPC